MCSVCGTQAPLTIVAKDEDAATALVASLTEKGAGMREFPGGPVTAWPTAEGATVTIPFAGDPEFAVAVASVAFDEGHVTEEEGQAMLDRGYAAAAGISVEEAVADRVKYETTGETTERGRTGFGAAPGESDVPDFPPDVEALLRSLGLLEA